MDELAFLRKLEGARVGFEVGIRVPGGGRSIWLTPEQVLQFVVDPVAVAAAHFGATKEDYLGWVEADGYVQCAATTKKGTRCTNTVKGARQSEKLADWVNRQRELCPSHQQGHGALRAA